MVSVIRQSPNESDLPSLSNPPMLAIQHRLQTSNNTTKSCTMGRSSSKQPTFRNQPERITKENGGKAPWANIWFYFYSSTESSHSEQEALSSSRWEARLLVDARDVSSVMCNGFWFSADYETEQSGCILHNTLTDVFKDTPWMHTRRYIFADPKKQWTAHLIVAAKDVDELANFRVVRDLEMCRMFYAWAKNKEDMSVYRYNVFTPERNFNTMHEDMPMKGLWPWPRAAPEITDGYAEYTDEKTEAKTPVVDEDWESCSSASTLWVRVGRRVKAGVHSLSDARQK